MKVLKYGKVLCTICMILSVLATLCGCGTEKSEDPKGKSYFSCFDTVSYIYSYAGDSAERFDELSAEAFTILEEYHRYFDIYHEYAGENNLCTLNKNAGGDAITVDEKLIDFLLYTKELYTLTDGEINVMLGAVLKPWHECREAATADPASAHIPDEAELIEASKHTDISLLEIDENNCTVRISDPDASIDVGAVGKGYATEMAARRLEELKVNSYVLNVGGNIRIIGTRPDGTGWDTGIKDPQAPDERFAVKLNISDISCVTSGVYERYFTVDGVRYHHIIDKDTLYPAEYFTSLTVLTKDSGLADALTTALFCMPIEEGRKMVESLDGVDAIWIFPDGNIEFTAGAEKMVTQ